MPKSNPIIYQEGGHLMRRPEDILYSITSVDLPSILTMRG